jgi:hypothetical protein
LGRWRDTQRCAGQRERDAQSLCERPTVVPAPQPLGVGHRVTARPTVTHKLASELIGERANRMGNRAWAFKLLDLITGRPQRPRQRTRLRQGVRIHREGHRGRPQLKQRPHDDLKGNPSLFILSAGCRTPADRSSHAPPCVARDGYGQNHGRRTIGRVSEPADVVEWSSEWPKQFER